jgi:uncharacterized protein (TIGR03790 family)
MLGQVQTQLVAHNLLTSAHYLVTTKGDPLKITTATSASEFSFENSDYSSVDSELTLAGVDYVRAQHGQSQLSMTASALTNPYSKVSSDTSTNTPYKMTYSSSQTFADFKAQQAPGSETAAFYLTSRLDAFTRADVTAMLQRAQHPDNAKNDYAVIDDDQKNYDQMEALNGYHLGANGEVQARGMATAFNDTNTPITTAPGEVMFYVGHGKNGEHPSNYVNVELQLSYADGAVFSSYESYNGRTMVAGANTSGQALIGDFIHQGGTAADGTAWEPFTVGIPHEEIWMPSLLDGYDLADAMWMSNEFVSWQSYVIGDPLMVVVPEPSTGLAATIIVMACGMRRRRVV